MIALRRISPGAWAMAALMAASVDTARPQEIEPRAYAATPLGVLFSGVSLGYTTGGIAFDATSPLSDVRATVYTTAIGVGGTFALAGRTANVSVGVPYAWAKITGNVQEVAARVDRSGLADARLRFAVGLLGGRAMSLGEFVRHKPSTYVGTSVTIAMPTGQYFVRQARKRRNEPVGIQARGWLLSTRWSVDARALRGCVVFYAQFVLPRRPEEDAGPIAIAAVARRVPVRAAALGLGQCHVLLGWTVSGRRRAGTGAPGEHACRTHGVVAGNAEQRAEACVVEGRYHASGVQLHHVDCRMADHEDSPAGTTDGRRRLNASLEKQRLCPNDQKLSRVTIRNWTALRSGTSSARTATFDQKNSLPTVNVGRPV